MKSLWLKSLKKIVFWYTILSNVHTDLPYIQVKRWDSSQRSYGKISRPSCITKCNKHMGGVDSLDALVRVYRIGVRGINGTGHIT